MNAYFVFTLWYVTAVLTRIDCSYAKDATCQFTTQKQRVVAKVRSPSKLLQTNTKFKKQADCFQLCCNYPGGKCTTAQYVISKNKGNVCTLYTCEPPSHCSFEDVDSEDDSIKSASIAEITELPVTVTTTAIPKSDDSETNKDRKTKVKTPPSKHKSTKKKSSKISSKTVKKPKEKTLQSEEKSEKPPTKPSNKEKSKKSSENTTGTSEKSSTKSHKKSSSKYPKKHKKKKVTPSPTPTKATKKKTKSSTKLSKTSAKVDSSVTKTHSKSSTSTDQSSDVKPNEPSKKTVNPTKKHHFILPFHNAGPLSNSTLTKIKSSTSSAETTSLGNMNTNSVMDAEHTNAATPSLVASKVTQPPLNTDKHSMDTKIPVSKPSMKSSSENGSKKTKVKKPSVNKSKATKITAPSGDTSKTNTTPLIKIIKTTKTPLVISSEATGSTTPTKTTTPLPEATKPTKGTTTSAKMSKPTKTTQSLKTSKLSKTLTKNKTKKHKGNGKKAKASAGINKTSPYVFPSTTATVLMSTTPSNGLANVKLNNPPLDVIHSAARHQFMLPFQKHVSTSNPSLTKTVPTITTPETSTIPTSESTQAATRPLDKVKSTEGSLSTSGHNGKHTTATAPNVKTTEHNNGTPSNLIFKPAKGATAEGATKSTTSPTPLVKASTEGTTPSVSSSKTTKEIKTKNKLKKHKDHKKKSKTSSEINKATTMEVSSTSRSTLQTTTPFNGLTKPNIQSDNASVKNDVSAAKHHFMVPLQNKIPTNPSLAMTVPMITTTDTPMIETTKSTQTPPLNRGKPMKGTLPTVQSGKHKDDTLPTIETSKYTQVPPSSTISDEANKPSTPLMKISKSTKGTTSAKPNKHAKVTSPLVKTTKGIQTTNKQRKHKGNKKKSNATIKMRSPPTTTSSALQSTSRDSAPSKQNEKPNNGSVNNTASAENHKFILPFQTTNVALIATTEKPEIETTKSTKATTPPSNKFKHMKTTSSTVKTGKHTSSSTKTAKTNSYTKVKSDKTTIFSKSTTPSVKINELKKVKPTDVKQKKKKDDAFTASSSTKAAKKKNKASPVISSTTAFPITPHSPLPSRSSNNILSTSLVKPTKPSIDMNKPAPMHHFILPFQDNTNNYKSSLPVSLPTLNKTDKPTTNNHLSAKTGKTTTVTTPTVTTNKPIKGTTPLTKSNGHTQGATTPTVGSSKSNKGTTPLVKNNKHSKGKTPPLKINKHKKQTMSTVETGSHANGITITVKPTTSTPPASKKVTDKNISTHTINSDKHKKGSTGTMPMSKPTETPATSSLPPTGSVANKPKTTPTVKTSKGASMTKHPTTPSTAHASFKTNLVTKTHKAKLLKNEASTTKHIPNSKKLTSTVAPDKDRQSATPTSGVIGTDDSKVFKAEKTSQNTATETPTISTPNYTLTTPKPKTKEDGSNTKHGNKADATSTTTRTPSQKYSVKTTKTLSIETTTKPYITTARTKPTKMSKTAKPTRSTPKSTHAVMSNKAKHSKKNSKSKQNKGKPTPTKPTTTKGTTPSKTTVSINGTYQHTDINTTRVPTVGKATANVSSNASIPESSSTTTPNNVLPPAPLLGNPLPMVSHQKADPVTEHEETSIESFFGVIMCIIVSSVAVVLVIFVVHKCRARRHDGGLPTERQILARQNNPSPWTYTK